MVSRTQKKVPCPGCGKPADYLASNPYRPFCSERCKAADLGAWASESYRIPITHPEPEAAGDSGESTAES